MPRTKLEFTGHAGDKLAALLEHPSHKPASFALFAHCFSCGKDIAAASRISRALVAQGIAVLRFDFTGLGNSDGDFSNTNFSSNVADLIKAADFLRDRYEAPALLMGHSLGGTAALAAASSIPELKAVATLGAPAAPAHVIKQFAEHTDEIMAAGRAEVDLGGRPFVIKDQFIKDVSEAEVTSTLGDLRKALLVMHSPVDAVVSINEAERIYVAAKHPKSFVTLDTAEHLLTNKADAEYAASVIAAWAARYVPTESRSRQSEQKVAPGEVVVSEHNQQFTRLVESDEQVWLADEPTNVGGHELGPDPYEHLLAALGTCTSMTMRMYANHKQLNLEDLKVTLRHERIHAEDCEGCDTKPMKLEVISRDIEIQGDLSQTDRDRLMEIADRCPVHRTLTGELRIDKAAV